jgi:hypothetical protein
LKRQIYNYTEMSMENINLIKYYTELFLLEEDIEYNEYIERNKEITYIFENIKKECKDLILPLFDKLDPEDLWILIYGDKIYFNET